MIIGLLLLVLLYVQGVGRLRRAYGWAERVDPRQVALFLLGVLVIFLALQSPLDELSDNYLFSAHMVQHLLLVLVAPPLLLLGTPPWLLRPLIRSSLVLRCARFLTLPVAAFVLFNMTFILWHMPRLYELGLNNLGVHIFQHLLFISVAVVMWWPIFSPLPELPRISYPAQILYLFVLSIVPGVVGGLITFSDSVIYPTYEAAPRVWGLSPIMDQQIGGLIMKIPGFFIFLVAAMVIFFKWFHQEELEARR